VSLQTALGNLGIKGKADLQIVAVEAAKARDAVLGSGLASDFEKKTAIYKALEAQIAYAKVAGIEIPAEQKKLFDELDGQIGSRVPKLKTPWQDFGNSVSTIITNTAQDIAKSLFDGNLSFAEKGMAALKSLGQAVSASFIEPATEAIGKFVGGVLADLIGGKGLGGVLGHLKDIGTSIAGIFGGASGVAAPAATAAGGAATAAGGAASTAAGVGGQAASVATQSAFSLVTGIVTGIVSAVSGVIGNFQMAGMNKSLDLIEHATRYAEAHLLNILNKGNEFWPYAKIMSDFNYAVAAPWMAEMQAYVTGGLTDRIMQVHDLIARTTNDILVDIRDTLQAPQLAVGIGGNGGGGDTYQISVAWNANDPTGYRGLVDNLRRGL
jgi:hypothetical protein